MSQLHKACQANDVTQVTALLARGADYRARDYRGWTPLDVAAALGLLPIVEALLEQGANPAEGDLGGYTPLYRAVKGGHEQTALRLLEAAGRSPVSKQQNPLSEAVASLLPKDPVTPDTLLVLAAEAGLAGFVQHLLSLSRTTWQAQDLALIKAASCGKETCLGALLVQPGVTQKDQALDSAIQENHGACVRILLESGATPSDRRLEQAIHDNLDFLPMLRERFPGRLELAASRVHCQHPHLERDEYGHSCPHCGRWWAY